MNLRNDEQHYIDHFIRCAIPTFREKSVREAILNAAAHRDYQEAGSVFIRQYARRIEIVSPGGFAGGVSAGNILDRQHPRNRRIAESFLRCGLVERSGQGVNQMVIEAVADSKTPPDYSRSDEYEIFLAMTGEAGDGDFVKFLKHLPAKQKAMLMSHHYVVLDLVRRNQRIPRSCRKGLTLLKSLDVVRSEGTGRAARYFLNNSTYSSSANTENYPRLYARVDAKKEALAQIQASSREGRSIADMLSYFPNLSRPQVRALLRDLQSEGLIQTAGPKKSSRWFPAPPSGLASSSKVQKSPKSP